MGPVTAATANQPYEIEEDDDEDEDDEDYKPQSPTEKEDDVDDEGDNGRPEEEADPTKAGSLTPAAQSAVDDAFASLFGHDGTTTNPTTKDRPTDGANTTTTKRRTHTRPSKKENMLREIFGGPSIAARLMATARHSAEGYGKGVKRSAPISDFGEERVEVRETKRFAGRDIEVRRTVVASLAAGVDGGGQVGGKDRAGGEANVSSTTDGGVRRPAPAGIDSLLSQINGPQKISTMTKTGADWDLFKDHAGLEEELKKKALGKDAFLVKKDFLDRVDLRKFEKEKEERERKRSAAAAAAVGR